MDNERHILVEAVHLTEADGADSSGLNWKVDIIREGMNLSGTRFYTKEALQDIAVLMNEAQCYVNHSEDLAACGIERSINETLGWYTGGKYDAKEGKVTATLHLLEKGPNAPITDMIREAASRGNYNMVGLSIAAYGDFEKGRTSEGHEYNKVVRILDLVSVDAVTRPGAGGKFETMLESMERAMDEEGYTRTTQWNSTHTGTDTAIYNDDGTATYKTDYASSGSEETTVEYDEDGGSTMENENTAAEVTTEAEEQEESNVEAEAEETEEEETADEASTEEPSAEAEADAATSEAEDGPPSDDDEDEDEDEDDEDEDEESTSEMGGGYGKKRKKGMESDTANESKAAGRSLITEQKERKRVMDKVAELESVATEGREALREVQVFNTARKLDAILAEAQIHEVMKEDLRNRFAGKVASEEEMKAAVEGYASIFDRMFADAGAADAMASAPKVTNSVVTQEEVETFHKRLDLTLSSIDSRPDPATGLRPFRSLREAMSACYGITVADDDFIRNLSESMRRGFYRSPAGNIARTVEESTRRMAEARQRDPNGWMKEAHSYMSEAIGVGAGVQWDTALGDSMYRVLLNMYDANEEYDWRFIVSDYVESRDLRPVHFSRRGMYDAPPAVAETAGYTDYTSATEDSIEIDPVGGKFGRLETVSLEALIRDDIGALRDIPAKLAFAFKHRQWTQVFNEIVSNTNPAYSSANTRFHTDNGNILTTAALSSANLENAIDMMRKQTPLHATWRMGLRPYCLIVPLDIEATAWELTTSAVSFVGALGSGTADSATGPDRRQTVANYFSGKWGLMYKAMPGLTDVNDWYLMAEPNRAKGQHTIGAVTYPNEMPQLSMQDSEESDNVFTTDTVRFKVSGYIAAEMLDHRTFVKATA